MTTPYRILALFLPLLFMAAESRAQSSVVPISVTAHGSTIEVHFSGQVRCFGEQCEGFTVRRADGSKDFHAHDGTLLFDGASISIRTTFSVEVGDDPVVSYANGDLTDSPHPGAPISAFSLHAVNTTGAPKIVPVSAMALRNPSENAIGVILQISGDASCVVCGVGFTLVSADGTKTFPSTGAAQQSPVLNRNALVINFRLTPGVDPRERFVLHYSWGSIEDVDGNPMRGFGPFNVALGPLVRDFNGDAAVDLVWQSSATRQVELWSLGGPDGTSVTGKRWLAETGPTGWRLASTGDFNRDGTRDLLWQHDVTRYVFVTYLSGPDGNVPILERPIATAGTSGWTVAATADFNLDGTPDIVWQNDATREVWVWYMGGPRGDTPFFSKRVAPPVAAGWRVVAAEDINLNESWSATSLSAYFPDLVWQNDTTGQVAVWFMRSEWGDQLFKQAWISEAESDARVAGAGDFDHDGNVDLVWQHPSTGEVEIRYYGGADRVTFLRQQPLSESGASGWNAIAR